MYASEAATGDRNRALAYLIRSTGPLPVDPVAAVETYFRQCAVRVTALDLAAMAATLANGGVNPLTGGAVVPEPVAAQVLAVMATCGMYDASGEWLLRVGLLGEERCVRRADRHAAPHGSAWPRTAPGWTRAAPRYAGAPHSVPCRSGSACI